MESNEKNNAKSNGSIEKYPRVTRNETALPALPDEPRACRIRR
jgi:hypothetical protein